MQIDSKNLISMTEANQNFSKVARMVDSNGAAIILKNNKPRYVLVDYDMLIQEEETDTLAKQEQVDQVAQSILSRHLDAFKGLAK